MNLADALENNALRRPDRPAVIDGARTLTHGQFHDLVCRWAAHLAGLGVDARDIVGVNLRDNAEHLVALYALARAGAAALPMDWRWTVPEKARVAGHFGAKLVLSEPGDDFRAADGAWQSITLDQRWHDAVAAADPRTAFAADDDPPLLLALSSGTTGIPKGPLITHRQFFARFMIYFVTLGFDERTRYLCAMPLYFGGSRGYAMCALYCGGTVLLHPPPYEAAALAAYSNRHRATKLFLVPTLLRRLLDLPAAPDGPLLETLDLLYSTGAVLHPEERTALMRRLNARYLNFYGSTDGGGCSALTWLDPDSVAGSVGRPVFGARLEIVGDDDAPLGAGEVGHIRYRHEGTASGYFNDPEASREAFRGGWYYPGDLGWCDGDGYLYLAGRSKDMIIRGGVNIYPAEIEHVLMLHASVHEAAVVGFASRELGEEIAAFVVRRPDAADTVTAEALIAHCAGSLARYKLPAEVVFLGELPKSGLGKVLKSELAARLRP